MSTKMTETKLAETKLVEMKAKKSKKVISEIQNREAFLHLLKNNPGLILLK
jgi:hypothetical protein